MIPQMTQHIHDHMLEFKTLVERASIALVIQALNLLTIKLINFLDSLPCFSVQIACECN